MPDSEVQEVSRKLDTLIRLLAFSLIEGRKKKDQLLLLSKAGFQPRHIAEMLGTTPNTVRVALSNIRKRKITRVGPKHEGPS